MSDLWLDKNCATNLRNVCKGWSNYANLLSCSKTMTSTGWQMWIPLPLQSTAGLPPKSVQSKMGDQIREIQPLLYTINSMTQTGNNALCRSHSISVYLDRNGIPPPKFRGSPPRANWHVSSLTWTAAESSLTGLLASMKSIVLLLS